MMNPISDTDSRQLSLYLGRMIESIESSLQRQNPFTTLNELKQRIEEQRWEALDNITGEMDDVMRRIYENGISNDVIIQNANSIYRIMEHN